MFSSIFKSILTGLSSTIKWALDPKNQRLVMFIIIGALVGLFFIQRDTINALQNEVQIKENNINALTSTIESYRTGVGDLVAQRGAFEGTIAEISKLNESLRLQLEAERDKEPDVLIVTEFVSEPKPIENIPTQWRTLAERRFELHWTHEESGEWGSRLIEGKNWFTVEDNQTLSNVRTDILQSVFRMNITTGLRQNEEGFLEAFVRTGVPDVRFINVQGARFTDRRSLQDPPKRWGIGFQVGYGVDHNFELSPYIGIGLSRNIIRW